jgi:thymidylate synthase
MIHPEEQYLDLLRRLLAEGDARVDRTKVGTWSLFGETLRFNLEAGMPLITTKKTAWKLAAKEMLWFLTGRTNVRELVAQGVPIWTDWPLKKYRESTGEAISQPDFERRLIEEEGFAEAWGDLGPVYGKQWRQWEGVDGRKYDQIAALIDGIRRDPTSRRLLFTAWNVADIAEMTLPPCHMTYQFHVGDGRLSCALHQRSADIFLGVPFNLFGAALLTHMIAQQTDLRPGDLVWFGGDVHLYRNAELQAREQIERAPRPLPKLILRRRPESIDDYRIEDVEVEGYDPHPAIKADVAV